MSENKKIRHFFSFDLPPGMSAEDAFISIQNAVKNIPNTELKEFRIYDDQTSQHEQKEG